MAGRLVLLDPDGHEILCWLLPERCPPDLADIDDLARLRLAAGRMGLRVRLVEPCHALAALVELAGLRSALGVEPVGQSEGGEVLGSDEVVVPDDPIA